MARSERLRLLRRTRRGRGLLQGTDRDPSQESLSGEVRTHYLLPDKPTTAAVNKAEVVGSVCAQDLVSQSGERRSIPCLNRNLRDKRPQRFQKINKCIVLEFCRQIQ